MLYHAQSGDKPAKVVLTTLPDNTVMVFLHDNIKKQQVEEAGVSEGEKITYTYYTYDEVMFPLPYDRVETEDVQSVTADFDSWWTYGVEYTGEDENPTLEQRVTELEVSLAAFMTL